MKFIFSLISIFIVLISANLFAENPCVVTKATGKDVGSLPHAALYCDGIITFNVKKVSLDEQLVFHANDNIEIDGANSVSIEGTGFEDALMVSAVDGLVLKNINLSFDGEACLVLTGFDSQVKNISTSNCDDGIVVLSGDNNELTQNNFINNVKPIVLEEEGNISLSAPILLKAKNYDSKNWELQGSGWNTNIDRIEVYIEKSGEIKYSRSIDSGDITATDTNFSIIMDMGEFSPYSMFHFLFVDKNYNTSEMSAVITPVKEEGFVMPSETTDETPEENDDDDTGGDKTKDPSESKFGNTSEGCSIVSVENYSIALTVSFLFIISSILILFFRKEEN